MDELIYKIKNLNSPIVVGLDTRLCHIPNYIQNEVIKKYGNTQKAAAEAIVFFNKKILDEIKNVVPAIKLQLACYEAYGAQGIMALCETAKYAKENGFYVIFDGKRNDIQSSMQSYSDAYLGETELFKGKKEKVFCCDSLTVNGYLGTDSIKVVLKDCIKFNKTIFVLLKTSNPSSYEIQDEKNKEGKTIYQKMGQLCEQLAKETVGEFGYGKIGAVVGATHKKELKQLRENFLNTFFLVPGYGAQKATADDVSVAFKNGIGAIINSSRKVLTAWQKEGEKEENFAVAAKKEAEEMRREIVSKI